ncbi:hypothetical protein U879_12945 [Defluviimonas sp. 20V17]|uniref:Uncharacterized membrane-anchored protein n=1 Tax=Allgaiera indica TaxID=765699 RepID=A0AAN4UQA1_9RHOB|nr:DUF3422 domain-containing protein [Allgaiera indica]KDB03288.1 hypothetical protein U879_12945 [Defluviimonas sp. 20V17]GHE00605.1 hypothetical protein GCM10008024_12790 [Allgaiera indica]SDW59030.1 Uncharacterized membrane-anchored protein [Allgaiera indica]
MSPIDDHPQRYALANELHARPFPALTPPCHAAFLAITPPEDAANRDRARDHAHLGALLARHGATLPPHEAAHWSGPIGRHALTWESHTEFVTYLAFAEGLGARPFDPSEAEVFPADWLAQAPGTRLTSVLIRVEFLPEDPAAILPQLREWFVPESLACNWVLDRAAVVAGDFRIDPAGHMRFAVFVRPGTGPGRVGRVVQRLCEIETYKAMSMLGLMRARALGARLNALDPELSEMVSGMGDAGRPPEGTLHALLGVTAQLEELAVHSSFRFGATGAYEALVNQRIGVLREERFEGRQTFSEFMTRRYDPAMRTVKSTEARLKALLERATRAGELLRTRVDVERSAQNQKLLESMDRRADLQLRLQHTVEGLSVVAISYYAVNLVSYALYPLTHALDLSKAASTAVLTPVVVLAMWLAMRRIRGRMH